MKTRKQGMQFIAVVLLISWLFLWGPLAFFQIPVANLSDGTNPVVWAMILFVLNGFVPSILGILMYAKFDGKKKLAICLKSIVPWKHGVWKTILNTFALFIILCLTQILLYVLFIGDFSWPVLYTTLPQLLPLLILGPLSEEIGWRGFLHEKLKTSMPLYLTSLVIGIVWALWHLPLFFIPGTTQHDQGISFLPFLVNLCFLSIIMGYFVEKAKGNIGVGVSIHWFYTYFLTVYTLGSVASLFSSIVSILPLFLLTLIIVIWDLKREKLFLQKGIVS